MSSRWIDVASFDDLADDGTLAVEAAGEEICLYKVGGRIYATHDDVDGYLAQSAQQTPLWTMRRSLVERLARPVGGEQGADSARPNAARPRSPVKPR
jgi:hypothetical protein